MNSSLLCALMIILGFLESFAYCHTEKSLQTLPRRFSTRPTDPIYLSDHPSVTKHIRMRTTRTSAYKDEFNDLFWNLQWYAQDYREVEGPVMDHNLVPVYRMNITGKGVCVAVVDDGVQRDVPDLRANYNVYYSVDANDGYGSGQPDDITDDEMSKCRMIHSHGTNSAGVIAMVANNSECGVGVAFNCQVSGLKVSEPRSKPSDLAYALNYRPDKNHIFVNTWKSPEDGVYMHKMIDVVKTALETGAKTGRRGKGSIYVFPAGTGRLALDNCAADEYINNPYTLGIAGVSQKGKITASERCFGIIATAYNHGVKPIGIHEWDYEDEFFVATCPGGNGCTRYFSGSATSVSLAAGIIALTLEANPFLSYRDVMHLITQSAEVAPLADNNGTWNQNAAGFWFSPDFGFGLLNAENMVLLARHWMNVPKERVCVISKTFSPSRGSELSFKSSEQLELDTADCKGDSITRLEQVELICTIDFRFRGALSVTLVSPLGTKSNILEPRPNDKSWHGLQKWGLRSLHTWGEDPRGKWRITVAALLLNNWQVAWFWRISGTKQMTLRLRGTTEPPPHLPRLPRTNYAAFRLPDGTTSHPLPARNPHQ